MFDALFSIVRETLRTLASNPVGLVSAYILYTNYNSWNAAKASLRDVLRRAGAIVINYGFYYFSQSISRAIVQNMLFPVAYGSAPSALWDPLGYSEWYNNETRAIDYALDYGPMVMPIVGLTLSNYVVDGIEYAGSKAYKKASTLLFSQARNEDQNKAVPVTITEQASTKHRKT
jgi:hypothetical protein